MVEERDNDKAFVFPNPNNGNFKLSPPSDKRVHSAKLYDSSGTQAQLPEINAFEKEEIMIAGRILLDGIYFVKLNYTDGTSDVVKFLKQ